MVRARKLGKSAIFGSQADEFLDVRPRMGPGWLATGKFGSKTKYLAKLSLSEPISVPETAKTGKQKIRKSQNKCEMDPKIISAK